MLPLELESSDDEHESEVEDAGDKTPQWPREGQGPVMFAASGVFYALKIQVGRNSKEFAALKQETDYLFDFKGDDRVVQMRGCRLDAAERRVLILMELGLAGRFFRQI